MDLLKCLLAVFLGVHTCMASDDDVKTLVGIYAGSVTFICDLPMEDPPQVAWKDNVWNMATGKELIFNSSQSDSISNKHLNKDNMEVNSQYQLTIKNLLSGNEEDNDYQVSSSGDYFCYSLKDGQWSEKKFFLVLAGLPQCEGNAELREGEHTQLLCSVPFSGNAPQLSWYVDGVEVTEGITDDTEIFNAMNKVDISNVHYMNDNDKYTCKMMLGEVVKECSLELNVGYKVRDIKIEPNDSILPIGTEIKCTALGNPAPEIITKVDGKKKGEPTDHGKKIVVKDSWLNQVKTITCEASNILDGTEETIERSLTFNATEIAKGVSGSSPPGGEVSEVNSVASNAAGLIAGIVIGALVLVVIIIAIVCLKQRNSNKVPNGAKPVSTISDDPPNDHV